MTDIVLDNLTKYYPRQPQPTLHHLSLTVQSGELLALLGPSGSGKSTILKLIAGIEHPDSGAICFNGTDMVRIPANRRGAALMFQKAYLFPFLTVADNIGFGLKVKGVKRHTIRAEVARMLDLVELPGFERRFPPQLSGGEQQRIALARALVIKPDVLMLDEPLSSLDTTVRQTLQEVLRRIQRETGVTTILVTHDLSEAVAMSDRTALLFNGSIAACDTPQRLFQRPPTRSAAQFVGISTFLTGTVDAQHVHTDVGSLALPQSSNGTHTMTRQATFAIRPEHMQVRTTPDTNTLPGIVADILYKGEYTEYKVSLHGNGHIVRVRDYQAICAYSQGDAIYIQFPEEHLFEVRESL